jgi:hypothetical protein
VNAREFAGVKGLTSKQKQAINPKDSMANFSKTAKGHDEVETRKGGLSPRLRRVLIVADGNKTVADLAQFCRPGEIEDILNELTRGGFVTAGAPAPGAPAPTAAAPAAPTAAAGPSEAIFKQVRQDASRYIYDRMGPAGDAACLEIKKAKTAVELRATLRKIEAMLAGAYGERASQDFARKFGQMLM